MGYHPVNFTDVFVLELGVEQTIAARTEIGP